MQPQIAIIVTTILRDDLLMKSINGLWANWHENWKVFIIDQNTVETDSPEKTKFYKTADPERLKVIRVKFNSGIAMCRNIGVAAALKANIPYCIISADSILFNSSFDKLNSLLAMWQEYPSIDRIGFELNNRIGWEGWIKLIPNEYFELRYIDKTLPKIKGQFDLFDCNICRNFFIAKTATLDDIQWDQNLIMGEHEDHAIRYGEKYRTCWTPNLSGDYIGEKTKSDGGTYAALRLRNWNEGKKRLLQKWNLKRWVVYR